MCKGPELCWRLVAGSSSKRLQHVCACACVRVCMRSSGQGAPPRSACDPSKDSDFHAERWEPRRSCTGNWPDFSVVKVSPLPPVVRHI